MVTVDYNDIMDGLDELSDDAHYEVMEAISKVGDDIKNDAKSNHRFESRTGRLESSIKKLRTGDSVEVYLDTNVARYAKYVHDGNRSWSPDTFINDAFDNNQSNLDNAVDTALSKAVAKSKL